ncbi:hypothetical protein [Geodermatophilus sp. CPCC 205506]|uniref:hypothetical protein n=1 Tax=Geodermatophilus sp. CPCC 205506 TaxID=2936596 RepID=UPI003EEF5CA1
MTSGTGHPRTGRVGAADRIAALSGAASVVITLTIGSIGDVGGKGLDPTMAPEALVDGLREHGAAISTGASFTALGAVLAVVFLGPLWNQLKRASEGLAVIGVAGGVLWATQTLQFAAEGVGLASAADLRDGVAARSLMTADYEVARLLAVPSLIMVATAVVAGFRYDLFPRWFRWFSLSLSVPVVIAFTPLGPAGLMGALGALWILTASVLFAFRPPDAP